ncbi:M3 family oligoendopeptidase [Deinococcus aestuarii]|uniref:M3 family oligoendopeptidase n=1 Tax=Deinococcus aestuarii TaxID=2774531 RepID=UPI001C0BAB3E|nr:M3 family oligoendopeptidase [Deinococcus aestuarii]
MSTVELGASELPRWRTDDLYAGLDDPHLTADLAELRERMRELETAFDVLGVRQGGQMATQESLAQALGGLNEVLILLIRLRGFTSAFVRTDSRNALAQQRMGEVITLSLPLGPLRSRLTAWLGEQDVEALLAASDAARAHEHLIRRSVEYARHQMTPQEEDLAARLQPSGAGGWAKLHGNVTSQLTGEYRGELLPITALRALATDPEEEVRKGAFDAELKVWKDAEVVLAAALNGVKGEEGTLSTRRGFPDSVAPSLLAHGIDRETLEAMQGVVVRSFPDFRRYFVAKARALGKTRLDWWDLSAPLGRTETEWTYEAGIQFVERQFRAYSDRLGDFAARALREGWVDAGPRPGKVGGASCMIWSGDASRILLNYSPSLRSASVLAHELGHGYHNLLKSTRTPLQRETPMTLAETASIFCETTIQNAALERVTGEERLYVLETQLHGHALVVVDIHARFLFERAVFEGRAERELTPGELCDLMTWAQRETYGDALATLHPYVWAAQPHYYKRMFSNYPYTFGLLFGLGLYAQYVRAKEQGREADFQARYDDLLSSTGLADARTLAARFGIDLHAPDFWEGSLDVIRGQIRAYEEATR